MDNLELSQAVKEIERNIDFCLLCRSLGYRLDLEVTFEDWENKRCIFHQILAEKTGLTVH
jgi:hypothetical protein